MRAVVVTAVATAIMIGCGGPAPGPHKYSGSPSAATLTGLQACRQLLTDVTRNGGVPDIPTLRAIADHVTTPRLAADARTAVRDLGHTGVAPLAIALLRADCEQQGVRIPAAQP
jgi:hypothetical protein